MVLAKERPDSLYKVPGAAAAGDHEALVKYMPEVSPLRGKDIQ